jgi:hypothetical protein
MSITVISSPGQFTAAYNQINYLVSSTNAAQPNFQFLADVYVGGVLESRLVFPKQPSSSSIQLDISPVIKNYVTHDLSNVYSVINAPNTNSQCDWQIKFGEVYDVSGIPTTYANLTTAPVAGSNISFNSIFDFEQAVNLSLTPYDCPTFGFLTSNPENITINQGDKLYLSFYDFTDEAQFISISGTEVVLTKNGNYYMYNVRVGWDELVALSIDAAILSAGSYTLQLLDGGLSGLGPPITVNLNTCNPKFEVFRLHWLNQYGGWDSFNFDKASVDSMGIDRSQFKKILPIGYSIGDRLKSNFNTRITDKIELNSNWVSDNMAEWLQSLFQSPLVMLEKSTGLVAVNVLDDSYTIEKYLNGRQLHNINLSIEYSYNRYRQQL